MDTSNAIFNASDALDFVTSLFDERITKRGIADPTALPGRFLMSREVLAELTDMRNHVASEMRNRYGIPDKAQADVKPTHGTGLRTPTWCRSSASMGYVQDADADSLYLKFKENATCLAHSAGVIAGNRNLKLSSHFPKSMLGTVRLKIIHEALRTNRVSFTSRRDDMYIALQSMLFTSGTLDRLLRNLAYAVVKYPDNIVLDENREDSTPH